jgi:hypothetical protein
MELVIILVVAVEVECMIMQELKYLEMVVLVVVEVVLEEKFLELVEDLHLMLVKMVK